MLSAESSGDNLCLLIIMTDSFLPEPVVVEQPKFTRAEGSLHSYSITYAEIAILCDEIKRKELIGSSLVRITGQGNSRRLYNT
jgi:hypothetical protein